MRNIIVEMKERGMIHNSSIVDDSKLIDFFNTQRKVYIGFDPTSDSLHIGSLAVINILLLLKEFGHTPVVLIGGATAMIGDPSGKSSERNMIDFNTINENINGIKNQLINILGDVEIHNNHDWFNQMNLLTFLRDVGKTQTIAKMMSRDSVSSRIETGISFTEFTYQLLQGYDFKHLHDNFSVSVQMGGSDQFGNMVVGLDMLPSDTEACVVTTPLLLKSDGGKFGKTEKGNVWLSSDKTATFDFFNFFINVSDDMVETLLKRLTTLPLDRINEIMSMHNIDESKRVAQNELANFMTTLIHSKRGLDECLNKQKELFSSNIDDVSTFDLIVDDGIIIDVLCTLSLFKSKSDIRKLVVQKGIKINNNIINDEDLKENISSKVNVNGIVVVSKGKQNKISLKIK